MKLINVAGATVWRGTLQAGLNQINLQPYEKGIYWVVAGSVKKQIILHSEMCLVYQNCFTIHFWKKESFHI